MADVFGNSERSRRAALRDEERPETWPVRPGMLVAGTDGWPVGHIKEVRGTDFLVNRPLARDLYVPYSACRALEEDRVILKVPGGAVGDQGWASPGDNAAW